MTFVPLSKFRRQIEFLINRGYKLVTLSDLYTKYQDDPSAIAITFDDGYKNVYQNAYPILQEYDAPATVFIITSCIGRQNDWDVNLGWVHFEHLHEGEIEELIEAGWEIGSHGIRHQSLKGKGQVEIEREFGESKVILEQKFHTEIAYFAAPFGKTDRKILEIARKSGYKGVCGFFPFSLYNRKLNGGEIPRLAVYLTDSLKAIDRKLSSNKLLIEIYKQNIINFCANGTILVDAVR